MTITRHFVDVGRRRVHYRVAGSGPPLLMIHQSPRSSAEYVRLMEAWGAHFTCIAPDTPGFGQSSPIGLDRPEVEDFADAAVDFLGAIGITKAAAYGYHSGAITLVTALKRHPDRFVELAVNGYAVWDAADHARLGERYIPPFQPTAYGEHLVWLWNRILEQTWFFPWTMADPAMRLPFPTGDPAAIQPIVMEMLESGDAYRQGYGAVLRANRDLPPLGAPPVPVAVVASRPDPLGAHLSRLGTLPPLWSAVLYDTPPEAEAAALAHLLAHPGPTPIGPLAEAADEGFVAAAGGLIHWRGAHASRRVHLHAPGGSVAALGAVDGLAIDLPGHGMSDAPPPAPALDLWADAVADAVRALGGADTIVGHGFSAILALAVAARLDARAEGEGAALPQPAAATAWAENFPDPAPGRFGEHLVRSWAAARAGLFYWPWFAVSADNAVAFDPADAAPERLRPRHLALAQAVGGRALTSAIAAADWSALVAAAPPTRWTVPDWAAARADTWKPER